MYHCKHITLVLFVKIYFQHFTYSSKSKTQFHVIRASTRTALKRHLIPRPQHQPSSHHNRSTVSAVLYYDAWADLTIGHFASGRPLGAVLDSAVTSPTRNVVRGEDACGHVNNDCRAVAPGRVEVVVPGGRRCARHRLFSFRRTGCTGGGVRVVDEEMHSRQRGRARTRVRRAPTAAATGVRRAIQWPRGAYTAAAAATRVSRRAHRGTTADRATYARRRPGGSSSYSRGRRCWGRRVLFNSTSRGSSVCLLRPHGELCPAVAHRSQ